jgi:hypothetical protein
MAITSSLNPYHPSVRPAGSGPALAFAAATSVCAVAAIGAATLLPAGHAAPMVATLAFVFAALLALVAWRADRPGATEVTYGDAAGALTLVGLFAAALIDPDHLVRIVPGAR